jgi:Transcriptional regulator, AbiEi antitoxin, Type IV TA system/Transcriptional regulator, AbiEi antitoxin N-terminal domain
MSSQRGRKINRLMRLAPPGTVLLSSWLREQGFSLQLQRRYRLSGWLGSFSTGAMIREADQVGYQGGLYALQRQANLPIHVGGRTALTLLGKGHFLELYPRPSIIFGPPGVKLPRWFTGRDWGIDIDYHRSSFLPVGLGLQEIDAGGFTLRVSTPARAAMECLYLASSNEDLLECRELVDGLNNVRPTAVQGLLENCSSIRVNRLFLFLAEMSGHAWVRYGHGESDAGHRQASFGRKRSVHSCLSNYGPERIG